MKRIGFIISIGLFSTVMMWSCQKEQNEDFKQVAKDNSAAESAFDEVFEEVDDASTKSSSILKAELDMQKDTTITTENGGKITFERPDSSWFPRTYTIDFGTGTTGSDGITRSGKIKVSITGKYRSKGTVITAELVDYKSEGYAIIGKKVITNQGENASGNLVYSIEVQNASVQTEDGAIQWSSSRKREWIAGQKTLRLYDDVYSITGTAEGKNVSDKTFLVTINEALIVKTSCKNITQGVLTIKVNDYKNERTVDYGTGECDKKATVTVGKRTQEINLR